MPPPFSAERKDFTGWCLVCMTCHIFVSIMLTLCAFCWSVQSIDSADLHLCTAFLWSRDCATTLKILLPPPSWWGLETDWHEFPNCITCRPRGINSIGNVSLANRRGCACLARTWGYRFFLILWGLGRAWDRASGPGPVPPGRWFSVGHDGLSCHVWRGPASGGSLMVTDSPAPGEYI